MSVVAAEAMSDPLASFKKEDKTKEVPVAAPRVGVVRVGEVAKTAKPVPVSSVIAEAKLAEEGVPKKVAAPEPRTETPVEIGSPVALVNVTEVGVPKTGVVRVGEVAKTAKPVPVSSVIAEAKLAEEGVPKKVAT